MTPEQIREVADYIGPNTQERDQAQRLLREYADLLDSATGPDYEAAARIVYPGWDDMTEEEQAECFEVIGREVDAAVGGRLLIDPPEAP